MSEFLAQSIAVLERTPRVLDAMLRGLPPVWTNAVTEGPESWSPYTVIGHLIHGEKTDWMIRVETILTHGATREFAPFDREAQLRSEEKPLAELLDEFAALRRANLDKLRARALGDEHLSLEGLHPAFGRVTLRQLLSTWTAHDLAHLVQINRVMARLYRDEVGPWAAYLSVMPKD